MDYTFKAALNAELKGTPMVSPHNAERQKERARMCTHICVRVRVLVCVCAHSGMSDILQLHELQPARLLCPWDFPGKNTRGGCNFLLQAYNSIIIIFLTAHFMYVTHY